jgi:uncharacterized protein (TIGR02596 family)
MLDNATNTRIVCRSSEPFHTMKSNTSRKAFSLVELLIVVLIIGIVAGFAVPAVQGMLKGSQLSQASGQLVDTLALARQTALSKGKIVEVRIYRFADSESPGEDPLKPETGHFRGLQMFEISDSGVLVPNEKIVRLPDSIIMNPGIPGDGMLSTILGDDRAATVSNPPSMIVKAVDVKKVNSNPELPRGVGLNYDYVAFRFLPDGSTNLPPLGANDEDSSTKRPSNGGLWYLTIHSIAEWPKLKKDGNLKPPANYFTLMVDPLTGTSKTFRPGLTSGKTK